MGDRGVPRAQDRLASGRPVTVATAGVELTLRQWGADDGRPLLYWHGLNPFGVLELNEAGPAWAEQGFRVVAFASPGVTDTRALPDLTAYRPTRLGSLVVDAADQLGLERFAFVGWSWGASIGAHLGACHGDRLDARTMSFDWLPFAETASFLGDYLAASWVGGRPLAIVPIASRPRAGRFDQSLYAAVVR